MNPDKCSACKTEPVSDVARQRGHNLCWICNGSRLRVAREAAEAPKDEQNDT